MPKSKRAETKSSSAEPRARRRGKKQNETNEDADQDHEDPTTEMVDDVEYPAAKKRAVPSYDNAPSGKKRKAVVSVPAEDDEDDEGDEEEEEEQVVEKADREKFVKNYRKMHKKKPSVEDYMTEFQIGQKAAETLFNASDKAAAARTRKNAAKKFRGYDHLSTRVGYGYTTETNVYGDRGQEDIICPLLAPSHIVRLTKWLPSTPGTMSYPNTEFVQHLEINKNMKTATRDVAREATAFADPLFRYVVNEATRNQFAHGGTSVTPATMKSVLAPLIARLTFHTQIDPQGLLNYAKNKAPPTNPILLDDNNNPVKDENGKKKKKHTQKQFEKQLSSYYKNTDWVNRGLGLGKHDADLLNEWKSELAANNAELAANNTE